MKKNEVKIGGQYVAKVSDRLVDVRIDNTNTHGGWNATNIATGKHIRVKSAQRLRRAVQTGDAVEAETLETPELAETANTAKPEAASDTVKAPKAKKAKAANGKKKSKRVSALDAAAQVLAKAEKPMRAQELIAAMSEQGLWSSPNGKTPHATLYAAMLREARDKGAASRFHKVDRGMFAFNANVGA